MSAIVEINLADKVGTWGAGSPCFCCGSPLLAWLPSAAAAKAGSVVLGCPGCRAEVAVEGATDLSGQRAQVVETEEPAWAAA